MLVAVGIHKSDTVLNARADYLAEKLALPDHFARVIDMSDPDQHMRPYELGAKLFLGLVKHVWPQSIGSRRGFCALRLSACSAFLML